MEALNEELMAIVERAKQARNAFPGLKAPDSLPSMTMAHDLAVLGQEFIGLSVRMKQAARAAADQEAAARNTYRPPRATAAKVAAAMIKNGAYRVQP